MRYAKLIYCHENPMWKGMVSESRSDTTGQTLVLRTHDLETSSWHRVASYVSRLPWTPVSRHPLPQSVHIFASGLPIFLFGRSPNRYSKVWEIILRGRVTKVKPRYYLSKIWSTQEKLHIINWCAMCLLGFKAGTRLYDVRCMQFSLYSDIDMRMKCCAHLLHLRYE